MTFLLRALTEFDADDVVDSELLPPSLRVRDDFAVTAAASNTEEIVPAEAIRPFVDQMVSRLSVEQLPHGGWNGDGAAARRSRGINHAGCRRIDARTAELTGEVLECVTAGGICVRAVCERAVVSVRAAQLGDGRWDSATRARFIYGTSCAVRGLIAAGVSADDPAVAQGVNWLLVHQTEAGGWGEAGGTTSAGQEFVPADATAIQTAWAVLALVAAGMPDHDAVRRGVNFLVESQLEHGGWRDEAMVERDSPHGPWYQNQLHSTSWSLLALAAWARSIADKSDAPAAQLRFVCDDSTR
jgi:squalene cyclase